MDFIIVKTEQNDNWYNLCLSHKFAANCRGDDRYGIELTISAIGVIPSGF